MGTFEHKGVYHSALRDASDEHGLLVRFKSEARESKYGPDKPKIIWFEVDGDDTEYCYNIENGDIESYLSHIPQNVWVKLFAAGSRDSASILAEDEDGEPYTTGDGPDLLDPEPAGEPDEPDEPPPTEWPKDTVSVSQGRQNVRERLTDALTHYYNVLDELTNPSDKTKLIEPAQKLASTELISAGK